MFFSLTTTTSLAGMTTTPLVGSEAALPQLRYPQKLGQLLLVMLGTSSTDIIAKWLMRGTVNAFLEGSNPSNVLGFN